MSGKVVSKSPVTTWSGVIAALGALAVSIGEALGNPKISAAGAALLALGTAVLGLSARDHGATSEQAGAVKPEAPK